METDWPILELVQVVKYWWRGDHFGGSEIPMRMQTILGSFPLNIVVECCFGITQNLKLMAMKLRQMQFEIS